VTWHPEPLEETLNWVLLPPGMYSQPLPIAYIPIWEFNRHGGPETFGFAPFGSVAEIPPAHGMLAHITDTDVDLYRPDLDPDLSFICGYHAVEGASDGRYAAWKQAALTCGARILDGGDELQVSGAELGRAAI
jgi:hypothetical protein